MAEYTDWQADQPRDQADPQHWHAYRARLIDGKWDYDVRYTTRSSCQSSEDYLAYLRSRKDTSQQAKSKSSKSRASVAQQTDQSYLAVAHKHAPDKAMKLSERYRRAFTPVGTKAGNLHQQGGPLLDARLLDRSGAATTVAGRSANKPHWFNGGKTGLYTLTNTGRKNFFYHGKVLVATRWEKSYQAWIEKVDGDVKAELLPLIVIKCIDKTQSLCMYVFPHCVDASHGINQLITVEPATHMAEKGPQLLPGEDPSLLDRRFRVIPHPGQSEELRPSTRANVARTFMFSHHDDVLSLGRISSRQFRYLRAYCYEVQKRLLGDGTAEMLADTGDDELDETEE